MWKGDFEVECKLSKRGDANEEKVSRMLGLDKIKLKTRGGLGTNILAKKLPEMPDLPFSHKLSIYGPGCLLGEEDIITKDKN